MQVKATRTMAAYLGKNIPGFDFSLKQYTRENYGIAVDYDLERNVIDYSAKTGKFSAIKVNYPAECFAMPVHLTTRDLNRIFRNSDRTETGFINAVKNEIAI